MDKEKMPIVTRRLLELIVILQEKHHLIKSGIPLLCDAIEELLSIFASDLENKISTTNADLGQMVQIEATKLLHYGYTKDINTYHKVLKQLKTHCGLVEPVSVVMGERFVPVLSNPENEHIALENPTATIIPFKPCLEQLLANKEVLSFIDQPYKSSGSTLIKTVKDGLIYLEHPVLKKYPDALLIQVYEDDLELVNPLGSRVKTHKLLNIYWMLLNIPDYLRSNLKCLNLLASCKSSVVKEYGHSALLSDFIENINKLESDAGLEIKVDGIRKTFHGALVCVNGDGLALNTVGGYKASFSFALKPCRTCNLSQIDMKEIFVEQNLREWESHRAVVDMLLNGNLTKSDKEKLSRDTGVTSDNIYSSVKNFDPTKCFAQDLMHNLLEGVVEVEARVLISFLIVNAEGFSIELLNQKIKNFRYPNELLNTRPSPIEKSHLENGLRETASQMICLLFILPFIVSPFINDENRGHIENFSLLGQITSRLLAYEICQKSLPMLSFMIEVHHLRFKMLYPNTSVKPKFHFVVHAPTMIKRFGPSRITWCMRYEGLNSWFSRSAQSTKNFISIEKSLAMKFQINRCADLGFGNKNHVFLTENDFNPTFADDVKISNYPLGKNVAQKLGIDCSSGDELLHSAKSISLKNFMLKLDSVLLVDGKKKLPEKPIFGKVKAIFIERNICVVVMMILDTVAYNRERFAFQVEETSKFLCYNICQLPTLQTFPIVVDYDKKHYVLPMYYDINLFDG